MSTQGELNRAGMDVAMAAPRIAGMASPGNTARAATQESQPAPFQPRSISVVFPAYNEELNIEKAVRSAREVMLQHFSEVEIIVVNDGSADGTHDILERLEAELGDLVPIHFPKNRGYGAALCTGLYAASKDLVFFSDSDLQFDLAEIPRLLQWIDRYDIVAGYREHRADPFNRRLNAWGWKMLVRMVLGLKVRDIDCAFKLFRRNVFKTVQLTAVGAMINTELLSLAVQRGMQIKEVPVSHFPRVAGRQTGAKLRVILRAFRELLAMRRRLKLA